MFLKHILHNSAFKEESSMALCVISSTRMSVVLSIKWRVSRSWKENKMLLHLKFGFKLVFFSYNYNVIMKMLLKPWKPDLDISMDTYTHMFVTFSDYFWSAVQRRGPGAAGHRSLSCFCWERQYRAFPCPASRPAALSAQGWLPYRLSLSGFTSGSLKPRR